MQVDGNINQLGVITSQSLGAKYKGKKEIYK